MIFAHFLVFVASPNISHLRLLISAIFCQSGPLCIGILDNEVSNLNNLASNHYSIAITKALNSTIILKNSNECFKSVDDIKQSSHINYLNNHHQITYRSENYPFTCQHIAIADENNNLSVCECLPGTVLDKNDGVSCIFPDSTTLSDQSNLAIWNSLSSFKEFRDSVLEMNKLVQAPTRIKRSTNEVDDSNEYKTMSNYFKIPQEYLDSDLESVEYEDSILPLACADGHTFIEDKYGNATIRYIDCFPDLEQDGISSELIIKCFIKKVLTKDANTTEWKFDTLWDYATKYQENGLLLSYKILRPNDFIEDGKINIYKNFCRDINECKEDNQGKIFKYNVEKFNQICDVRGQYCNNLDPMAKGPNHGTTFECSCYPCYKFKDGKCWPQECNRKFRRSLGRDAELMPTYFPQAAEVYSKLDELTGDIHVWDEENWKSTKYHNIKEILPRVKVGQTGAYSININLYNTYPIPGVMIGPCNQPCQNIYNVLKSLFTSEQMIENYGDFYYDNTCLCIGQAIESPSSTLENLKCVIDEDSWFFNQIGTTKKLTTNCLLPIESLDKCNYIDELTQCYNECLNLDICIEEECDCAGQKGIFKNSASECVQNLYKSSSFSMENNNYWEKACFKHHSFRNNTNSGSVLDRLLDSPIQCTETFENIYVVSNKHANSKNVSSDLLRSESAIGSYTCDCLPGFKNEKLNYFNCLDIDECTETISYLQDDLSEVWCRPDRNVTNSICNNLPGSFECQCETGYQEERVETIDDNDLTNFIDKIICADIDECASVQHNFGNCTENSFCNNTIGSYTCDCNQGYFKTLYAKSGEEICQDINECDNLFLGHSNCYDLNIDSLGQMLEHSVCVNKIFNTTENRGYDCVCPEGFTYKLYEDGTSTCLRLECSYWYKHKEGELSHIMARNIMNPTQIEAKGGLNFENHNQLKFERILYTNDSDPTQEELRDNPDKYRLGPCHHNCTETSHIIESEKVGTQNPLLSGSYDCACAEGFEPDNEGRTKLKWTKCKDINECKDDRMHHCSSKSHCENTEGSHICHNDMRTEPETTTVKHSFVTNSPSQNLTMMLSTWFSHLINGTLGTDKYVTDIFTSTQGMTSGITTEESTTVQSATTVDPTTKAETTTITTTDSTIIQDGTTTISLTHQNTEAETVAETTSNSIPKVNLNITIKIEDFNCQIDQTKRPDDYQELINYLNQKMAPYQVKSLACGSLIIELFPINVEDMNLDQNNGDTMNFPEESIQNVIEDVKNLTLLAVNEAILDVSLPSVDNGGNIILLSNVQPIKAVNDVGFLLATTTEGNINNNILTETTTQYQEVLDQTTTIRIC